MTELLEGKLLGLRAQLEHTCTARNGRIVDHVGQGYCDMGVDSPVREILMFQMSFKPSFHTG
jgi:hypothetical protein